MSLTLPSGEIALHRDPGIGDRLTELPAWVAPATPGLYWHIPRSAELIATPKGRKSPWWIRFWCGQFGNRVEAHQFRTTVGTHATICATCVGRFNGYAGDELTFRPHDHFTPPRWCPGADDGTGHCSVCVRRLRYYGAFNSSPSRHEPAVDLTTIECCQHHGWRDTCGTQTGLRCNQWRCEWTWTWTTSQQELTQ